MEIGSMTYGTSDKGIDQLKSDIKTAMITKAKDQLGKDNELITALKNGWEGADRDVFIENFHKMVDEVEVRLDEYYDLIDKQLSKVYDDFIEFQSKNVSAGGK